MSAVLPLIRISPSEFQFVESRTGYTSRLRLTSLQQQAVGFKFKTNAPHKFLVKPVVCALTKKGTTVDVIVKSTSPITDADRFLIQTVALDASEAEGLDSTKWRKLDPSRIMEDLIHCTVGLRRSSVSSHSSSGTPPLVTVSHVYDPYVHQQNMEKHNQNSLYQPLPIHADSDNSMAISMTKQFYQLMPGIDVSEWSWSEFAMFVVACILLGFFLPAIRLLSF
ncbi:hypothetical protein GGI15_002372 [Coemansia interrupta]|uniref:MSP domain-containing protein n=1 Tax=Coemansia interrupta TaxID=1126814 RepID=A0A9W8HFI1_9FUNG|nr:hypothetical protein GGI15_002372 [Coemansia interrupta]